MGKTAEQKKAERAAKKATADAAKASQPIVTPTAATVATNPLMDELDDEDDDEEETPPGGDIKPLSSDGGEDDEDEDEHEPGCKCPDCVMAHVDNAGSDNTPTALRSAIGDAPPGPLAVSGEKAEREPFVTLKAPVQRVPIVVGTVSDPLDSFGGAVFVYKLVGVPAWSCYSPRIPVLHRGQTIQTSDPDVIDVVETSGLFVAVSQ